MKLSVIIPARNEEHRIETTLMNVGFYLKQQSYDYEIIVVINDSHDQTHAIVTRLQSTTVDNLTVVSLERGGKGNAVKTAVMQYATGDIIMFMDADNATPISEIEKFFPYLEQNYSIVIGSRYTNPELVLNQQPWYRIVLSRLSNSLIQLLVIPGIKDTQLGFKAFTYEAAQSIFPLVSISGWGFDMEVLTIGIARSYSIKEVGVLWTEYGGGKLPLAAYIESFFDLLTLKIKSLRGVYAPTEEKFQSQIIDIREYDFSAFAGLLAGMCMIPVALNLGLYSAWVVFLPIVGLLSAVFVLWFGVVLSKLYSAISQFSKFVIVGILNVSINFGFLNLVSLVTGVTGGLLAAWFNIPGTIIAAINSYLWNKFWVFRTYDEKGVFYHFPKFSLLIFVDIVVNSFIIVGITTYLHGTFGFSDVVWLNIAKILATAVVMFINFFGYKFIVFRTKRESVRGARR